MEAVIFDRVNILSALQDACLLAGGKSAVVLGAHKVGKSYLLDHLYKECAKVPDTIFCRMNLDMLKGWSNGTALTDDAFYLYFVERLNERISEWIDDQTAEEADWTDQITDAAATLQTLDSKVDADAREHSQELVRVQQLRRQQLADLERLKKLGAYSQTLVQKPHVSIREVITLLDQLQRLRKRVVLFIDDYQRLLTEPALTDNLFNFLRAANNDGTIIALVTSPVHLMDASLHQSSERPALFNHFNVQLLEPFTDAEADAFLQWPAERKDSLTKGERGYVRSLAGRAPFFLKAVRDQFLQKSRPSTQSARRDFEATLEPLLEGGFRDLWRRCSPSQRALLRQVAANQAVATAGAEAIRLNRDGYLVVDGGNAQMFSPLFASFINQRAQDDPEPEIESSAHATFSVFPTALAFAQPGTQAAVMTFTLRNPTPRAVKIRISWELQGYAPPASKVISLARGEEAIVETPVVLSGEKFREVAAVEIAQLQYSVEIVEPMRRVLEQDVVRLRMLANDNFVFARRDDARQRTLDYTWLIAAWVQVTDSAVAAVRAVARETQTFSGYPSTPNPEAVRAQVKALYDAVKKQGIKYDTSTLVFHHPTDHYAQRVRTPRQVLAQKAANCLDGSVLFASLLAASDLSPLIVFVPGHAFVGWKTDGAANAPVEFLETTLTDKTSFEEAVANAQARYQDVEYDYQRWQRDHPDTIADVRQFAIGVDIQRMWQERWIRTFPTE